MTSQERKFGLVIKVEKTVGTLQIENEQERSNCQANERHDRTEDVQQRHGGLARET